MRTETLKVGGMTCGGCVNAVTKALKALEGVKDVAVSLQAGEATIEFDEQTTSSERLRATVQSAGYEVQDSGGTQQKKSCGRG